MRYVLKDSSNIALETAEGSFFLENRNGEKAEFQYNEVITLIFQPSKPLWESPTLSFFYWVRAGPYETSKYVEFGVPDRKTAKRIAEDLKSRSVKMDPSIDALMKE